MQLGSGGARDLGSGATVHRPHGLAVPHSALEVVMDPIRALRMTGGRTRALERLGLARGTAFWIQAPLPPRAVVPQADRTSPLDAAHGREVLAWHPRRTLALIAES